MKALVSILSGLIFGLFESLGMDGTGGINVVERITKTSIISGNFSIYLFCIIGFTIACIFTLKNEYMLIFKGFYGLFLKNEETRKSKRKSPKLYTKYSIGILLTLIISVTISKFVMAALKETLEVPFFTGIGFVLTAFFMVLFILAEKGNKKSDTFALWASIPAGIVAGIAPTPGVSCVIIIMLFLSLVGFDVRFAYKYALISDVFVLYAEAIFTYTNLKLSFNFTPLAFVACIISAIFGIVGIGLGNKLINSKIYFVFPLIMLLIGIFMAM